MSIANELNRIIGGKASLAAAIAAKGVSVPSTTRLDGYAALVNRIPSSGAAPVTLEAGDGQIFVTAPAGERRRVHWQTSASDPLSGWSQKEDKVPFAIPGLQNGTEYRVFDGVADQLITPKAVAEPAFYETNFNLGSTVQLLSAWDSSWTAFDGDGLATASGIARTSQTSGTRGGYLVQPIFPPNQKGLSTVRLHDGSGTVGWTGITLRTFGNAFAKDRGYYMGRVSADNTWEISRVLWVNGVQNDQVLDRGSVAVLLNTDHDLEFEIVGNQMNLWFNGAKLNAKPVADSLIVTGQPGLRTLGRGNTHTFFRNFTAGKA